MERRIRRRLTMVTLLIVTLGVGWAIGQSREVVAPESLLPGSAALYVRWDGLAAHEAAWKQTAAYKALVDSGLADAAKKLLASAADQAQQDPQAAQAINFVSPLLTHVGTHGVSAAAAGSLAAPPYAALIVHRGAGFSDPLAQLVDDLSRGEAGRQSIELAGRTINSIHIPDSPAEVVWWPEGGHLVVAVGIRPAEQVLAIADGQAPDITTHRLYNSYAAGRTDFEQTSVSWLDFQTLRESFGTIPLPFPVAEGQQPRQVKDLLSVLGLDTLEAVGAQGGFQGRSCRTDGFVVAPGPKNGLLKLMNQSPMTLADLPPFPAAMSGAYAARFDLATATQTIIDVIRGVIDMAAPDERAELEEALRQVDEAVGLNVMEDLLTPLGDVLCVYNDSSQGALGLGIGLVVNVDDAARLRASVGMLLGRLMAESRGKLRLQQVEKAGRLINVLEIPQFPISPSLCIDDEWLCVSLSPQLVESFLMRLDGDLPRWEPTDEVAALLADMPSEFVSLALSDPRPAYQLALTWGPMLLSMAQGQLQREGVLPPGRQAPFHAADVPPVERVIAPLHLNIAMQTASADGLTMISKSSLPGLPFVGGGGGGGSGVATSAVLVALLLPAVQQAREAARRTQSSNNLKQIALALHNYHEIHRNFPPGTMPNADLKPDQRLSWQAAILPYVDQGALYNRLETKAGWNATDNQVITGTSVPVFQNPSIGTDGSAPNQTHYAGCAGLGTEGPLLPVTDKRAGVFGYDRVTKIRDIRDGTSNTLITFEVSQQLGPWAQGGHSTIRPLTQQPYIHGPDGIGGHHAGGALAGLADGSVRFLSENVDPSVMEALSTINGGESVGDF